MKYPFQPLEEILASRLNADPVFNNGQAWGATNHRIITFLRCSMTSLRKFRTDGLPEDTADRYAKLLGLHPFNIWPNWLQDLEQECEADGCSAMFVPSRRGVKFCSARCRSRMSQRAVYWRNREAALQRQKEFRAENRRVLALKRRLRYAENRERELERQRAYDRRKAAERRAKKAA